jgi:hypothetical protein
MTRGISRKQRLADQRRAKSVQGVASNAKKPSRPSVGCMSSAVPEPLPPMRYPLKRVALGKRQVVAPLGRADK